MPNYNYVADAHYKPYSFQEMLMPLTLYKQESDKREQEYLDYADRMDAFRQMAEDSPDSYAAQIYNNYSNDYQKAYNDYIEHGLNIGNKNDWLNLKRRYRGEIGRLEEADKILKELQKNMRDKGSSYLWGNSNPTLDDILHNPNYVNYGIDSNELYKKGVEAAASASSKLYGNTRFQDVTKYYQEAIQTQGYDPKLIASFRNDLEKIPELRDALNDILVETGADKGLSGYNLDRAVQAIINGMVNGANASYKETRSIKDNPGVMTAAQAATYSLQREARDFEREISGYYKDANDNWQYDPKRSLKVKQGEAEYRAKHGGSSTSDTDISSLAMNPRNIYSPKEKVKYGENGQVFDATRRVSYEYKLKDSSMQNMAKQNILTVLKGQPLREVEMDDTTDKYKETGKKLTTKDLSSNDYTVISDGLSIYGNTVTVLDKDGNVKEYRMPSGINPLAESNRDNELKKAADYQKKVLEISKTLSDNGVTSPDNIRNEEDYKLYRRMLELSERYKRALQSAQLYHSQLYVTNETDPQKFKPYGE